MKFNIIKKDSIKFTHDQEIAVDNLIRFIDTPWSNKGERINALCGAGGTGKTFVIKYVLENCKYSNSVIACAAPTHKACRVLSNSIGGKKVNTIQSLFGFRLDVDIDNFDPNNPAFNPIGNNKLLERDGSSFVSLLVIDEASMLNSRLVKYISDFCKKHRIKIIFIGDSSQLPPVNESSSYAFLIASKTYYLKEVVRQGQDNPISHLLDLLRYDIGHKGTWKFLEYINTHKEEINDEGKGFTVCNLKEFGHNIKDSFSDEKYTKDIDMYRVIAYTNNRVSGWNNYIRKNIIKDNNIIGKHDLLMSYVTIVDDFNDAIINNSEEYIIKEIIDTIDPTYSFKGFFIKFQAIHGGIVSRPLFVIDHSDSYTFQMYYKQLNALKDDALSADKGSKSSKWRAYFEYKKKYLIATNIINPSSNTILFSRDIDYGFAITSHKSQGSTYKNVFVDINDIVYDKNGHPYTNRDELLRRLYVACSRASNKLILCYGY